MKNWKIEKEEKQTADVFLLFLKFFNKNFFVKEKNENKKVFLSFQKHFFLKCYSMKVKFGWKNYVIYNIKSGELKIQNFNENES